MPRGLAVLPGSNFATSCYFVGDDAFTLSKKMMKPFTGPFLDNQKRIFNYRISRARRVIENAFGILVSRFRVFESKINFHPGSVDLVILAAVCLHNFIRITEITKNPPEQLYEVPAFLPEDQLTNTFIPHNENCMQESLKQYFLTPEGEVPWQNDVITYTPDQWEEFDRNLV